MFRSVARGKFRQLVRSDGRQVDVALYRCVVDKPPYVRGGKTYVALDLIDAMGDMDVLRRVDEYIEKTAFPEFSPFRPPLLIVKIPTSVTYQDVAGKHATTPFLMKQGDEIDVVVRPGAFGSFGYCWLLTRVKPHGDPEFLVRDDEISSDGGSDDEMETDDKLVV